MRKFQDLLVWQKAHRLVLDVYRAPTKFPQEERYGLVSQMRRAAVLVPANIVEGHRRRSKREFVNFVSIARGSLEELRYYIQLSKDLAYLPPSGTGSLDDAADEIGRMPHGLKAYVNKEMADEKTRLA